MPEWVGWLDGPLVSGSAFADNGVSDCSTFLVRPWRSVGIRSHFADRPRRLGQAWREGFGVTRRKVTLGGLAYPLTLDFLQQLS